jgi:hypothetical protein
VVVVVSVVQLTDGSSSSCADILIYAPAGGLAVGRLHARVQVLLPLWGVCL